MNPYLFLFISHYLIESTILEQLSHFQNIHIYIDEQNRSQQQKIFEQISQHVNIHHQHIYLYAFSEQDIQLAQQYFFDYHFCFHQHSFKIENSFFQKAQKEHKENFYIIDQNVLDDFVGQLHILQTFQKPISFVVTNLMNKKNIANYQNFYDFIQKINKSYHNPIQQIEFNLADNDWQKQKYIHQTTCGFEQGFFIMGIWGDLGILGNEDDLLYYYKLNQTTLLRNKQCIQCLFLDKCMKRGIGFIMKEQKMQTCIAYHLL